VKRTLSTVSYSRFTAALKGYKSNSDFMTMMQCMVDIFGDDQCKHRLLRSKWQTECFIQYYATALWCSRKFLSVQRFAGHASHLIRSPIVVCKSVDLSISTYFLIFINDIISICSGNTTIKLYADVLLKLCSVCNSTDNSSDLQQSIDKLVDWSK